MPFGFEKVTESMNQAKQARDAQMQAKQDAIRGRLSGAIDKFNSTPLSRVQAPGAAKAETFARQAAPTGPLKEFDAIRNRAKQEAIASGQRQNEALARRFAATGMGSSGAAIKQQQLASDASERRKDDALGQVEFQEAGARRELEQRIEDRNFQGEQAAAGRNLSRESEARQLGFQADTFNSQQDFQQRLANLDANSKLAALDQQFMQFNADREDQEFNKQQALDQARKSGGLFGAGGFLGTGIGA